MDTKNTTKQQSAVLNTEDIRLFLTMILTMTLISMWLVVALYVFNNYGINNGNSMMTNMPIPSVVITGVAALLLMSSLVVLCVFISCRLRDRKLRHLKTKGATTV